jgi:hypothetical protein
MGFIPREDDFLDRLPIAHFELGISEHNTTLPGSRDPRIDAGGDPLSLEFREGAQLLHHQLAFRGAHVEAFGQGPKFDPPGLKIFHDLQKVDQGAPKALKPMDDEGVAGAQRPEGFGEFWPITLGAGFLLEEDLVAGHRLQRRPLGFAVQVVG